MKIRIPLWTLVVAVVSYFPIALLGYTKLALIPTIYLGAVFLYFSYIGIKNLLKK